jgi:chromosome segregation ATPase
VLALYARPQQTAAHNSAAWEAGGAETDQAHIARLKSLLQAAETELAELRARNSTLAQQVLLREREPALDGVGAPPTLDAADKNAQELLSRVRQDAERELASARAECEEARRASARNEESLKALSQAYNALEAAHFRLEEELRQASAGSADGGVTLERLRAAVAEARQAGIAQGAETAAAEHEQEMSDLLVCLGQEEAKVVRLCRELEARGVDTGPLLAQDDDDASL